MTDFRNSVFMPKRKEQEPIVHPANLQGPMSSSLEMRQGMNPEKYSQPKEMPSQLDQMWAKTKGFLADVYEGEDGQGGIRAGLGALGALGSAMGKGNRGAMLEGLVQSSVADKVDAGGIFAGKTPANRRFVSPSVLEERKRVADIIKEFRSGKGRKDLLEAVRAQRGQSEQ